jgi:hypothetical protein
LFTEEKTRDFFLQTCQHLLHSEQKKGYTAKTPLIKKFVRLKTTRCAFLDAMCEGGGGGCARALAGLADRLHSIAVSRVKDEDTKMFEKLE